MADIDRLFRILGGTYGSFWANNFPNAAALAQAKNAWESRLGGVPESAMDRAILALDEAYPTRPPNLIQFTKLCGGAEPSTGGKCHTCGRETTVGLRDKWYCDEHNPQMQHSRRAMLALFAQCGVT